jgi:phosphoribosyl-AMP cyclohydrolase
MKTTLDLDLLDFTKSSGLVTVVVQDATTGSVLMIAHADREAMQKNSGYWRDALQIENPGFVA